MWQWLKRQWTQAINSLYVHGILFGGVGICYIVMSRQQRTEQRLGVVNEEVDPHECSGDGASAVDETCSSVDHTGGRRALLDRQNVRQHDLDAHVQEENPVSRQTALTVVESTVL